MQTIDARELNSSRYKEARVELTTRAQKKAGDDLLSHNLHAVPSTLESLTTEFGMGSGVTSLL